MFRARVTDAVDFYKSSLAKTAAAEIIFIESAGWRNDFTASLGYSIVDLIVGALTTSSINKVVPKCTCASLLLS
jgi:hypothetical protein